VWCRMNSVLPRKGLKSFEWNKSFRMTRSSRKNEESFFKKRLLSAVSVPDAGPLQDLQSENARLISDDPFQPRSCNEEPLCVEMNHELLHSMWKILS
jgi:hypothetical protein